MKHNSARKRKTRRATTDKFESKLSQALEYHKVGDLASAQTIYCKILEKDRHNIDALYLLGTLYVQTADFPKAVYYLTNLISLNPRSSIAHNNLGIALEKLGELESARQHFESAVNLDKANSDAYINLGNVHQQLENYSLAIQNYNTSLEIVDSATAYLGLGNTYRKLFEADKALHNYKKAISISPNLLDAYTGLGLVLSESGKFIEAIETYQSALDIQGDHARTRWNMALLYLSREYYNDGWQYYDYGRLTKPPIRQTLIDCDHEWDGRTSLTNKSILVYSEQGIGDEIMFASCIPDLKRLTENIHIIADQRLGAIFQRSLSPTKVHELNGLESVENCINEYQIDYSIPSGSLPGFFRKDTSDFPDMNQYLYCDPVKASRWKKRYDTIGDKPKIGISWQGGVNLYERRKRSASLCNWVGLLTKLKASFINLQYGSCSDDIFLLRNEYGIEIHDWEDSDPLVDMDDFFAKVGALDLVITIDNSTAHVAGSQGIPTIVLLPEIADWRWLQYGDTSKWYPSLRLLRKPATSTWDSFIEGIENEVVSILNDASGINRTNKYSNKNIHKPDHILPAGNNDSGNITIEIIYQSKIDRPDKASREKCAIITPVGPGHEAIIEQCKQSLHKAASICSGKFSLIEHICVDDTLGNMGRSHSRNIAVKTAFDRGIDWLFFIDADDLMAPNAFEIAAHLSHDYDAIWGKICSFEHANNQIDERKGQLGETTHLQDIVFNDPYLTLQMGHFVRTIVAMENPFNETMNTGEDFDYYLRVWKNYRCIRTNALLFINRRGFHSSGPRSASGSDWRPSVEKVIDTFCHDNELIVDFTKDDITVRFIIRDPFDIIQRQLIYRQFFEIGELEFIQKIIPKNSYILEVGANIGNHVIYYSKFMACQKIVAIEPNPKAVSILQRNLELNNVDNVKVLQIGAGSHHSRHRLETRKNNLGATQLVSDDTGDIQVVRLDDIIKEPVNFIKIDVENMELDVIEGARKLIESYRPMILIEVMNPNIEVFKALISEMNYKITKIFENINASNFFIEPE